MYSRHSLSWQPSRTRSANDRRAQWAADNSRRTIVLCIGRVLRGPVHRWTMWSSADNL